MNTYTAKFSTGTVTYNFKRNDYTHAWVVKGERDGVTYKLGAGFTTSKKAAESRAKAVINFEGYGEAEIVEVAA